MIQTRSLTRSFRAKEGAVEAVRGVDIDIEAGELVGFLGPNGAGKSTTIRMLTTLLLPTSGRATVAGRDVVDDPRGVRARIGYVGQGNSAGDDQRARDELVSQGRCCGLGRAEAARRADDLLGMLELDTDTGPAADRVAARLSGGQRRRLDVAMGLIHRPDVLFLDEPSTGLDPHSRANLWDHIRWLRREQGTTILLTTHYLEEADSAAERILVIDHGTVIADGTPDELKGKVAGDQVVLATDSTEAARDAAGALERVPGTHAATVDGADGTTVRLGVDRGDAALPELMRALATAGVRPRTVQVHRPTLDDVFLSLTGRSLRDGES